MENKKDRLEELFRRSLGEEATPTPEGWNEPSPDVWGKIQAGSGMPAGPRFGLGFWKVFGIAAAVLLVVAAIFIWRSQAEIDTLQHRLQAVEAINENENLNEKQVQPSGQQGFSTENTGSQANSQAAVSTDEVTQAGSEVLPTANDDAVAANGNGLSANASATSQEQSASERSASGNSKVGQGSDLPKADENTPQPSAERLTANATKAPTQTQADGQQENLPKANENLPQPAAESIAAAKADAPTTPEASSQQATPQALALPQAQVISQKEMAKTPQVRVPGLVGNLAGDPDPPIKNPSLPTGMEQSRITNRQSKTSYVGLTASPQFTLRQTTGLRPDQANQTVSTEMTFATGLQSGFQIAPRWRLETGLQHSASRVLTENVRRVNFRMQDEQPDQDGQLQSSYTLALSTSAGTAEAEVDISRSPTMPVMDGREIPIRLTMAHETRQLDLPVLANFRLLDGPLSIGLRAGLMARYSLASTLRVENVQIDLPAFRYRQNRFVGQVRDAKTDGLSMHLLAGIDVDYRLSEHLSLSLSPTFAKALKPTADNGQTKTYLNTVGLYGGVRWWF